MRIALAVIPFLLLAGCGGGENSSTPVTSATPVAQTAPPAGKQWTDVVSKTAEGGFVQGNPNAPIKLVEYGSRNCPTCGRFAAEGVEPLRQKYVSTGKVSYEFRDFLVHGAPDFAAALLNQCVPTEAFFPVLDQFFANQETFDQRTRQLQQSRPDLMRQLETMTPPQAAAVFADALGYVDFIKQRGVPEAQARQCLTNQARIAEIAKVNADAVTVHQATGTPTFYINGQQVQNVAGWAGLEPALQAAGAR